MRRQAVFTLGTAILFAAPLIAQDPPTTARRSAPTTLSDSQRAQLRTIQDKYRVEFTKHREEMTALRQKMQAEVEQALPAELRERFAARGEAGLRRGAFVGQRRAVMVTRGRPMGRGIGRIGVQGMGMRPMAGGVGMGRIGAVGMGRRPMAGGVGMGRMGAPGMGMRPMAGGVGRMAMPGMGRGPTTAGVRGGGIPAGPAWGQGGAMTGVRARVGAPATRVDSLQAKRPARAVAPPAAAKAKPGPG